MISNKTLNTYRTVLQQMFINKNEIIQDKNVLYRLFDNSKPSCQNIIIPALIHFKNEFNLCDYDIKNLKERKQRHTNIKEFEYMNEQHINKFKLYLASNLKLKDKLILTILFDLGVRKFEVKKVIEGYLNNQMSEFNIIGKHQQIRKIFLTNRIIELLELSKSKYNNETILKWSVEQTVYRITKKCFKHINYHGACHDFRRHFAQNLDERGQRLTVIKSLMGHKNINTTSSYIRQSDNELRDVINNQHSAKPIIDNKMYHELINKLARNEQTLNNNNDMIENLLNKISELTELNQILNYQNKSLIKFYNKKRNDKVYRKIIDNMINFI